MNAIHSLLKSTNRQQPNEGEMSSQAQSTWMNPEREILYALTRQVIGAQHLAKVRELVKEQEIHWDHVYAIANQNGVGPLVYSSLLHCVEAGLQVPDEILHRFKLNALLNSVNKKQLEKKTHQIVSFLLDRKIHPMLIKGAALDLLVYKQPWYTFLSDLDIIIRADRDNISPQLSREIWDVFLSEGIRLYGFEWECFGHHDVSMDGVLPVDFEVIWNDASEVDFHGHRVYVMVPEDLLLTACINSSRKRYARLKSLCDIAEITHRFPNMDWDRVLEKARRYRIEYLTYAALYLTQNTLGCALPIDALERIGVSTLRASALRGMMEAFGRDLSLATDGSRGTILRRKLGSFMLLSAGLHPDQLLKKMWVVATGRRWVEYKRWPEGLTL